MSRSNYSPRRWSAKKSVDHARKPLPSYRLHKPSGNAFVSFKFKTPEGDISRCLYLGKWGTPDSHEFYAEVIKLYSDGVFGPDTDWKQLKREWFATRGGRKDITVEAAAERFMEHVATLGIRSKLDRAKAMVSCFVELFANARVSEIGPPQLKQVRKAMVARGWSRGYVNAVVTLLKEMYRWLVEEQLVPVSVYETLRVVKGLKRGQEGARETSRKKPVELAVLDATLERLPEVVADMVRVQRFTAMRPGELCAMRPAHIDRTSEIWVYRPREYKTQHLDKNREVFIGARAQEVLSKYLLRDPEAYCFSPRESEEKRRGRLGEREFADHYGVATYRRAINRAAKTAEVPQWSPHQLRHLAATEIRKEFGLEAAQVMLGHTRADVTQIYAEVNRDRGIDIARKIG